jgi:phosphohistidine phosphatase
MRTLILLRHAKSDYPQGVVDRDRPLAARGERDARAVGVWLHAAFPLIDEVVVSPALRARQTWQHVTDRVAVDMVREDDRVYADWGSALREVVAGLDPRAESALIVGHNPGIEELALHLSQGHDSRARDRIMRKYPTAGIAVVGFHGAWGDQASTELLVFAVPRAEPGS